MNARFLVMPALAAVVLLAGCDDPAKNKTKAVTTEATPLAAGNATTTGAATADYGFDQSGSTLAWTGSKVTGKHDGTFGTFKGTVHVVDGALEKSAVNVQIDATTLKTEPEMLQNHLKSKEFFKNRYMNEHRYVGYWEDTVGISEGGENKKISSWEAYEPAIATLAFSEMGDRELALEAASCGE